MENPAQSESGFPYRKLTRTLWPALMTEDDQATLSALLKRSIPKHSVRRRVTVRNSYRSAFPPIHIGASRPETPKAKWVAGSRLILKGLQLSLAKYLD